jgi:hypothetical protein
MKLRLSFEIRVAGCELRVADYEFNQHFKEMLLGKKKPNHFENRRAWTVEL